MTSLERAVLAAALALAVPARGEAPCPHHPAPAAAAPARTAARTVARYEIPGVALLDQEGRRVPLAELLAPGPPVALNFIFTTCTTVCPVMSASFAGLAKRLGETAGDLRLVSVTIDPDNDRPAALAAYARRFGVGPRWRLLTGSTGEVAEVIAAFDALRGEKTGHRPVTLLRPAGASEWIRLEGLASAEQLAAELQPQHALR